MRGRKRGEMRYYNFIKEKISLVIDLYDTKNYEGYKNYYSPKNPLTAENKISPQMHSFVAMSPKKQRAQAGTLRI